MQNKTQAIMETTPKNVYRYFLAALFFLPVLSPLFAQLKVGINPTSLNRNAAFEVASSTQGMLLPRLELQATTSVAPLQSPVDAGMLVYNTATVGGDVTPGVYYYDSERWVRMSNGIYNMDGSLGSSRNVYMGTNTLAFDTTTLFINPQNNRIGIKTTTPAEALDVNGNIRCKSVIFTSDATLKQNIQPLSGVLGDLLKIGVYSYNWKDPELRGAELQFGVLAQEIEKIYPNLVTSSVDHKAVNYNQLIPLLIQAIREQQTLINYLLKRDQARE